MGIESNTAVIDVTHEQLKQLLGLFERYLPATAVWAFGSRAKWTSRPDSDLDLVVFANAEQARQISALREAFDESSLPFRIDLLVWEDLPKSFHQNISAQYVVLVEATPRSTNNATKWRKTTLGEVAGMVSQKVAADTITLENYVSTENMLPNFGGVQTSSNLPALDKFHGYLANDTLFSNIRTYFKKVWFADKSGGASADVLIFRSHDAGTLNPRFLSYLLCSQTFIDFSDLTAKGAKMPRGDKGAMLGFAFKLPPLAIQRAIAGVLGALDDKIALNRRMNATLEAMAQALFKDWFVDFGPVRAKMAGSAPTLDAALWDLFPSDIGADGVPVGWVLSTVGEQTEARGGTTPSTKNPAFWENGVHAWATPKDLSRLETPVLFETERTITDLGLKEIGSGLLPAGALLMSSRAPIGYFALTQIPTAMNQGFIGMVCNGVLNSSYMLLWCKENMPEILSKANGSTFLEISRSSFRPMPIVVPNGPVLAAFYARTNPIFEQIVALTKQSKNLATLRDTLLPKLFSGEVKIDDVLL